jgi:hypothetical protein
MKKSFITAISIFALASCTTETRVIEKAPDTTQYSAPAQTQPPYVSRDTNFLSGLTNDYPSEVAMLGKAKLLEMGGLTCDAIDEGSTIEDFALLAVRNDVDAGFIGALIREAVENYCPDNQWFIDSVLNA